MKRRKYQASDQNLIVTGMIVSDEVLGAVYSRFGKKAKLFKNRWCNSIAEWCLLHYSKYQKAPRAVIQTIFEKEAERNPDEEGMELIEQFLSRLDDEYKRLNKEMNHQFVIDLAAKHFTLVAAEKYAEVLETAVEAGDIDAVREANAKFEHVSFDDEDFIHPMDSGEVSDTLDYYEQNAGGIIKFPGDLGRFLNDAFEREGFVAFCGAEKKGKSYWLYETAWRGLSQGKRVLYYVLGDMSKRQFNMRSYRRACLRPRTRRKVRVPKSIKHIRPAAPGENPAFRLKESLKWRDGVSRASVKRARERLRRRVASNEERLKVRVKGGSIVSASDIERDVKRLCKKGWIPDIVIVDYADLLKAEDNTLKQEYRHQINETWKILRRIAIDYHLLMVVATQAAASNYSSWLMKKKDFSEDKRKNAHVSGMIGLNQSPDEHRAGVYRLNWVFLRDGEWSDNQYVWTAGNLALGCPCMVSTLGRDNKAEKAK